EVIESEGTVGIANAITVDDNGDEHIAYVNTAGRGVLKYAERRSGIWMFQKVDLQSCGTSISMAMDLQGRAHISYYDMVRKDLRYASSIVVPSAPTNLTTDVGDGFITLDWLAPQNDGGSNITEYRIFRAEAETGSFVLFATVGSTATTFSDLGLENGVTYLYRVRAVNTEGSSHYSNEVSGTPCTLPGAPSVDASGRDKAVALDWDEPDDGGAAIEKYNIYRKNETGMWLLIGTVDGTVTKYTDTGLENGVEYSYYVTAVNPAGEGPVSDTASATANPSNDMLIIIIVVIVILAAAGVGAFFLLRKGRF
ncbi:MAG: fibronectin type III domain-containing protein, partial [Methanomassiliicoccales archaeon]|nr:fibronectin type III domain-containing protein [Methanomassiliicoccales archaeon]